MEQQAKKLTKERDEQRVETEHAPDSDSHQREKKKHSMIGAKLPPLLFSSISSVDSIQHPAHVFHETRFREVKDVEIQSAAAPNKCKK